ncbi:MAG: hypothetical protein SGI94_17670 [Saprospiraceae bacterium]|nr:hypothetical protein [Saprospiraceae bacterium]
MHRTVRAEHFLPRHEAEHFLPRHEAEYFLPRHEAEHFLPRRHHIGQNIFCPGTTTISGRIFSAPTPAPSAY